MRWATNALCIASSLMAGASASSATGAAETTMTRPNMCESGVMQSPIDLHSCAKEVDHEHYNMPAERPKMKFDYYADRATLERVCGDVGVGCYLKVTPGSDIGVVLENSWTVPADPTHTYQLEYCDVRMPSEHTVNGKHYPLEVQCVHYQDGTDKKKKGILSVLYERGESSHEDEDPKETYSGWVGQFEKKMPNGSSTSTLLKPFGFDFYGPDDVGATRYYSYEGSHTTGSCTEDAEWYVMYDPAGIGQAQLKALEEGFSEGWMPPRPVQKAYGRHPHGCMHNPVAEDAASPSAFGALSLTLALFSLVARV